MDRILIAILLLMFVVLNCSNRGEPTIDAHITASSASETVISVEGFRAGGFTMTPVIMLNEELLYGSLSGHGPDCFHFVDDIPWIDTGDECCLYIDYGDGVCEATEIVPGDFTITSPTPEFTLYPYAGLTTSWETSVAAEWYRLTVYMMYLYYDTDGESHVFQLSIDTTLQKKTYKISADRLYPDDVASIDAQFQHTGKIHVAAASGPEPNSHKSNIDGDGSGTFRCYYWTEPVYFTVAFE